MKSDDLSYIASCLMGEKLHKYQVREITKLLKDICFFSIANGNNPFFDCSCTGKTNETFRVAKYVSQFRPVIFGKRGQGPCRLVWKGRFVAKA